jgi:hypothetical protein
MRKAKRISSDDRSTIESPDAVRKRREARRRIAARERIEGPIRRRIETVLRSELRLSDAAAKEAAFHLLDWIDDLARLHAFFENPRRGSGKEVFDLLLGFVVHVPWHVVAAHRIIMGYPVEDPFELGAVRGSGREKRRPGEPYSWRKKGKRKRATTAGAAPKKKNRDRSPGSRKIK